MSRDEAGPTVTGQPKILIIRRDNIGDLVCTTPIIRPLRERFPGARLCALVNSYNAAVVSNNPDLDEVFVYTKVKHRRPGESAPAVVWDRVRLLWRLRRERFDYVILANARFKPRPLRLARFVKPRHIVGFTEKGCRGGEAIDMPVPHELPRPVHEAEDIYRLLAPFGIHGGSPRMRVVLDSGEAGRVRARVKSAGGAPGKRLIGVHLSARKPSNRWPAPRFAELIRNLHQRYDAMFLLFWAPGAEDDRYHPGDDGLAARVVAETPGVALLPCPTHRLDELIAGLSCCDAVICSDGGALHIAAALGKPILCFFGESNATRWYPWQVPHVLLQAPSRQATDITVADALGGCRQLLAGLPAAPSRTGAGHAAV